MERLAYYNNDCSFISHVCSGNMQKQNHVKGRFHHVSTCRRSRLSSLLGRKQLVSFYYYLDFRVIGDDA